MSLNLIGFVYMYLVLFALLANAGAIFTVATGGSSDAEYLQAVLRLQTFAQVFVIPLALTSVAICLHGVLFTHRIAGPIHRFKESLQRFRSGDLSTEIKLRKTDYFHDLCEDINAMVADLRSRFVAYRELSTKLAEQSEALANAGDLPTDAQKKLIEITTATTRLRQFTDQFHLGGETVSEPKRSSREKVPTS